MGILDEWKLRVLCSGFLARGAYAWVESYDGGEDDEKVIKIMLPMIAIAVLACVVGYYIKNKFFKNDEKDEDKDIQEKSIAGMNFPAPKANKPWLNMAAQGTKGPIGPPGGYEYTLPGYQQATDKRTNSQNSGKSNASSGYASHMTGVHQVSEKRRYQQRAEKESRENKRDAKTSKSHKSDSNKKSKKSRDDAPQVKPALRPPSGGKPQDRRRDRPNPSNPQAFNPASRPSRGGNRH